MDSIRDVARRKQEAWDEFKANLAMRAVCHDLRENYEHTGNPLHAWYALRLAARYDIDAPGWVLEYLAGAAERLLTIDAKSTDQRTAIVNALDLSDKVLTDYRREREDVELAERYLKLVGDEYERGREDVKDDPVFAQIARETGKSASTVRRRVRKYIQLALLDH